MRVVTSLAAAALLSGLLACQTKPSQAPAAKSADAAPAKPPPKIDAGLPAGPYHVLAPLRDTAAFDTCGDDTDCVVAPLRCCDCAHGGLGVAIAKGKLGEWPAASCTPEGEATAPPTCGETPTDDPTCRAAARCLNGRCRLTVQAATEPASGTK